MPAILKTERLLLRPLSMDDAPRIAAFAGEPDIARMVTSMPQPYPPIAAEGFIMTHLARAPLARDHIFAMDLAGEGLIGIVGAHVQPGPQVEIGYWVGKPFWGRGFASEAACAVAGFANELNAGQVVARHFADNPASGRVLEKAGFVYTGETIASYSLARSARVTSRLMTRPAGAVCAQAA